MKKIVWPGILAGIIMLIAGFVLWYLFSWIFPSLTGQYNNVNIFRPWTDPLMSLYFAHPIALGLILAWVWSRAKGLFKGTPGKRAVNFGLAYWLVGTIPGMIITYASFQVSLLMTLTWTVSGLVNGIIAGLIFAKMNK